MRLLTSGEGDFLSCFDKLNGNNIHDCSKKQILIINHQTANKGKTKGHLSFELISEFCNLFIKVK